MNNIPTELEISVVGGVLRDPSLLVELDWLEPGHFGTPMASLAFGAIRNLEAKGSAIDTVTVGDEMGRDLADDAPAFAFLGGAMLSYPTTSNVFAYAARVRDHAMRRAIRYALALTLENELTNPGTGAELLSSALQVLARFDAEQPDEASTIGDVIRRRLRQLEQIAADRQAGTRTMTGYPSGVANFDEKIGGWQAGIVSIVAARPAMGKSSFGLATADECSRAGFGVHLFSLEDTESSYADRTLSRASGVAAEDMRNASLSPIQMRDVSSAVPGLIKRKWLVDGRSGITADEIVRSVRKRRQANDTRVVIVDYVQLVKKPPRTSSHDALTEIVTTLADAAKHDNLAYVVMSQLNRQVESRTDKRPQLSDLRESGSLEERAKCVVGVYRASVYGGPVEGIDWDRNWRGRDRAPSQEELEGQVQLLVLKNSNGRTGPVWASWSGPTTRLT